MWPSEDKANLLFYRSTRVRPAPRIDYRHDLWLDDTPDLELSYNRGEGLQDNTSGECRITIKDNKVTMKSKSENFDVPYMTHLLELLKARYKSLRGYVSCSSEKRYWIVTDAVTTWTVLITHEIAKTHYEASSAVQTSRKRAHDEEDPATLQRRAHIASYTA